MDFNLDAIDSDLRLFMLSENGLFDPSQCNQCALGQCVTECGYKMLVYQWKLSVVRTTTQKVPIIFWNDETRLYWL